MEWGHTGTDKLLQPAFPVLSLEALHRVIAIPFPLEGDVDGDGTALRREPAEARTVTAQRLDILAAEWVERGCAARRSRGLLLP
jgi:hypothetical protein